MIECKLYVKRHVINFTNINNRPAGADEGTAVIDCRVYAEKFDALGIRLYITKIRDGDDGTYTCKARITDTGQMLEQETRMFLYGN